MFRAAPLLALAPLFLVGCDEPGKAVHQEDTGTTASCSGYKDDDNDGFGAGESTNMDLSEGDVCTLVLDDTDCNNNDPNVNPDAQELCDGKDNDCDDEVDEDLVTAYYLDADGDNYGVDDVITESCDRPTGYAVRAGDCNDLEATVYPGADELCDGKDNDCDKTIDEDVCGPTWNVFLLSGGHLGGDFGGIEGADRACTDEAADQGHTRTFKAWLSDSDHSPAADFTRLKTAYTLPSGNKVADNWTDLTDGDIDHAIDEDVTGTYVGAYPAWTGTDASGDATGTDCNDWTDTAGSYYGTNGYTAATGTGWSEGTTICSNYAVIYCFGQ